MWREFVPGGVWMALDEDERGRLMEKILDSALDLLLTVRDLVTAVTPARTTFPERVVWGMNEWTEPVFIDADLAAELATLRDALWAADTRGDLRERLPALLYADTVAACSGEDSEPPASTPFDPGSVGVIADGDWPAWPAQEMLHWMPAEIVERCGEVYDTVFNRRALRFSEEAAPEVAAALAAMGVAVTRDDDPAGVAAAVRKARSGAEAVAADLARSAYRAGRDIAASSSR